MTAVSHDPQALAERLYKGLAPLRAGLGFVRRSQSRRYKARWEGEKTDPSECRRTGGSSGAVRPRVFPKTPTALVRNAGRFPV
jgi:hypothetical protein